MPGRKGKSPPMTLRREIVLYCTRMSQKEGEKFGFDEFQARCGLSKTTIRNVMGDDAAMFSDRVLKRLNMVLHNGGDFTDSALRYNSVLKGKSMEVPSWFIPAIRTHLESKRTDKEAEDEVGVYGGALRKICNGVRLKVRESNLRKLEAFYADYHVKPTGPSPRDLVTAKPEAVRMPATPKDNGEVEQLRIPSVHASETTTKLANRLIDAFNHLSPDDRELLCSVAECIAKSSSVSTARAYATNLEKRLERQDEERATAESERDKREASLLAEVNRQKALLEQWNGSDIEGLKAQIEIEEQAANKWKERYDKVRGAALEAAGHLATL